MLLFILENLVFVFLIIIGFLIWVFTADFFNIIVIFGILVINSVVNVT